MKTLLADESVDFQLILALRKSGYKIISILEEFAGISDIEVLSMAYDLNALLLTED